MKRTILVTGAAGFIGANLVKEILRTTDDAVVGLDNLNSYYDPALKEFRLKEIESMKGDFTFVKGDIADKALIESIFEKYDNVEACRCNLCKKYYIDVYDRKIYRSSGEKTQGEK